LFLPTCITLHLDTLKDIPHLSAQTNISKSEKVHFSVTLRQKCGGKCFLAFNTRVSFRDDYYCYFSFPDNLEVQTIKKRMNGKYVPVPVLTFEKYKKVPNPDSRIRNPEWDADPDRSPDPRVRPRAGTVVRCGTVPYGTHPHLNFEIWNKFEITLLCVRIFCFDEFFYGSGPMYVFSFSF
jgi:hypothetical protein